MRAEELITLDFWKEHQDFDDYESLLSQHLDSIKDQLKPIDPKGHETNDTFMYNSVLDGTIEDYQRKWLISDLHNSIFYTIQSLFKDDIEKQYEFFINYLNNGFYSPEPRNNELLNATRSSSECHFTGRNMKIGFNAPFTPILLELGPNYKWREAQSYTPPGLQHMLWDCPSGELIAADWIRIDEFSERSRRLPYTKETSVNHIEGRIGNALRTNAEMNLLDISLGNMAVEIYQNGNQLIIGDNHDYDRATDKDHYGKHPGFKKAGKICTDRWTFTCIDRVHLERILKEEGVDDPKGAVDAYLKEDHYGVTQLKVKPGTYHVYFCGDYSDFNLQFNSPEFKLADHFRYYTVISDKELTLEPPVATSPDLSI